MKPTFVFAAAFLIGAPVCVHAQEVKGVQRKPVPQLPTVPGRITVVAGPLGLRQQASLAGLGPVYVRVSALPADVEAAGLHQSELLADAVAALKSAGVPLTNRPAGGKPHLVLTALVRPLQSVPGSVSVTVLAELMQPVLITRAGRPGAVQMELPTWQDMDYGVLPKTMVKQGLPQVRGRVKQSVASFVAAYKAANKERTF